MDYTLTLRGHTFEITRRSNDYHACLPGRRGVWGRGRTPEEASEDVMRAHREFFEGRVRFPEHVKLGRIREKNQACADFLEWLLGSKGYHLGKYHVHTDACWPEGEDYGTPGAHAANRRTCGTPDSVLYPETVNIQKLLAEFFEIDEGKLEVERRAILDEHSEGNSSKIAT